MARERLIEEIHQGYMSDTLFLKWAYFLFGGFLMIITLITKGIQGLIAMSVIIGGSYVIIQKISDKSKAYQDWSRKEFKYEPNFPLKKTSKLIKEGNSGSEVSKALLEERIRQEILRKVKREKNISEGKLEELISRPEGLASVIDDRLLCDFVLSCRTKDDLTTKNTGVRESTKEPGRMFRKKDGTYREKLKKVIKRAREWGG